MCAVCVGNFILFEVGVKPSQIKKSKESAKASTSNREHTYSYIH